MTALRPTLPAPKTARVVPAAGRSTVRTVPTPVWTLHPSGATTAAGRSSGTLTVLLSVVRQWEAKADWPKKPPCTGVPSVRESGMLPSGRVPAALRSAECSQ